MSIISFSFNATKIACDGSVNCRLSIINAEQKFDSPTNLAFIISEIFEGVQNKKWFILLQNKPLFSEILIYYELTNNLNPLP